MTRTRQTVLTEAQAGVRVQDLCRAHGISDATFDRYVGGDIRGPGGQRCEVLYARYAE
jgi:hypothetical protein